MRRYLQGFAVVAGTVLTAGCLVDDTTHRLYVSPDGALAWTVLQQDIHSDQADPSKRWAEEKQFLDALAGGVSPIAEGFRELGGENIRVRPLRVERPYVIVADARFARIDQVIGRVLAAFELAGRATLTPNPHGATLIVVIDLSVLDDDRPGPETPVTALIEDLDRYRIALTEGRFVAATGFTIVDDGTVALFKDINDDELKSAGGTLTLSLTWKTDRR